MSLSFPCFFPFWLLFGDLPVSSGRFLASFPFEPASNLTPAFPAVFPGSVVALVSCLFLFESSSRFLFLSFFLFGSSSESRGSSRLLFGDPPVSSGRFLASFPFEPASNLTPAFPAVFPGSVVALLFVSCLFLFESSSRFLSFHFSFSAPLRRAAGLFGSSSETRRSRPDGLASFPFEPASNLTPAFPAAVPAFSFQIPFPVACLLSEPSSHFLWLLFSLAPLRRAAGLVRTVFGEFS